ncbi:MAG: hypothetical protein NTX88_10425 [Candidatus Atribacteria bacterium]|nr:hypothetical protein [Candidatus Atribacteria bacterium]
MTSKERIKRVFQHQEVDRVPLFELTVANPILSMILGRKVEGMLTGESKIASLRANRKGRDARLKLIERNISAMVEAYKKIGFDMLWIRPTEYLTPVEMAMNDFITPNMIFDVTIQEINENTYKIVDEEHGFWSLEQFTPESNTCPTIDDGIHEKGIDELRRYISVLEKRSTALNQFVLDGLEGTRLAIEKGKTEDLYICGCADIAFPTFFPWIATFMEMMHFEPETVHRYMEATNEGTMEILRAQLAMGVDGVIGTNDWCYKTGSLMSPTHFRTFLAPYLKQFVDECHKHGVPYIKHLDGNTMPIIDILVNEVGIDGLHSIEPTAGMDINWVKKTYGDKIVLFGNLDCGNTLVLGKKEDVVKEVKEIISIASPGGGHVFSTSNCIHSAVNPDNFQIMLQTVKEYGTYPIKI